ncbi:MAG: alanine racemase [Oscillospiraceae bacterium]|nr:alanine racemase [Oscillospiraceae bacterium]
MSGRAWAEVDLGAIRQNIINIRRITRPEAMIMGVVKADGYGHGAAMVSKVLLENGADRLAVATISEAVALRREFPDVPIMMLSGADEDCAAEIVENDIIPTVFDLSLAGALSKAAAKQGKTVKIHIKIDTGMNRVGLYYSDPALTETAKRIADLPGVEVEGVFTHFSKADETDLSYAREQFARFMDCIEKIEAAGVKIKIRHCCNSAGIMNFPEMHLDMVRPGIILYGLYPSQEVDKTRLSLIPAMSFKARISEIKTVPKGSLISYGGTYAAPDEMTVGTASVGYADGYSRVLSGKVGLLVGGEKRAVLGRICMDQCIFDMRNVHNTSVGDSVTLFGGSGENRIPVEEIAELMGTINYEIICMVGKRVPRIYI